MGYYFLNLFLLFLVTVTVGFASDSNYLSVEEKPTTTTSSTIAAPFIHIKQRPKAPLQKTFLGASSDFVFSNTDIEIVLQAIADVGDINIVTTAEVTGNVTLKLKNTPWDEALNSILSQKKLVMYQQSNVIVIAKLGQFNNPFVGKTYQGERLSLNFTDSEVKSLLPLFADFNDLQLAFDSKIAGNVTLRLANVQWDLALDVVLLLNGLEMHQLENILVIAPAGQMDNSFEKKTYHEKRLSLNFTDIEVKSLLPLFADFNDLQLALDSKIAGNVTLRLANVQWDLALDAVLLLNGLEMHQLENVLVVAPAGQMATSFERKIYEGRKLSLNFQDIEVRSLLELLADFMDLDILLSDAITGSISIQLSNAEWDLSLDIVLLLKNLSSGIHNGILYTDVDSDNDGMPNNLELLLGRDPFVNESNPVDKASTIIPIINFLLLDE